MLLLKDPSGVEAIPCPQGSNLQNRKSGSKDFGALDLIDSLIY
jgi:hypothetical protein